ncbi:unnamed protein product [Clonostachys rosea]|uniref:GH26 domain-containing protein n=1 Tax=Bionectria ochroleuca TaxID=29856 RepID=A0ABY6UH45_BIOOC|nr:unnamed protein product [Clonostachys rosea]
MLMRISLLLSLAASCLATPTPAIRDEVQTPLGTWLWESTIISDTAKVATFLDYTVSNGVQRVFAQVNTDIQTSDWQNFISQCAGNGMKVEALIGNPQWVIGTGTPSLQSQLDWIQTYQAAATTNSGFTGIHMDVEPWGLDDWETNKAKYIEGWEEVAQKVASSASSLGITVAADLPFWANTLDSTTAGQTIDIWMLKLLDYATFMTYRNTVPAFLEIAAPVLAAGNEVGKPVWLAVETISLPEEDLSYYGQSASKLQSDLNEIAAASQGNASFAGIAVHDYDGWSALPRTA